MRVLMTGGGTAGHINPALAIADTIKKNDPDAVIEFVGTEKGLEKSLVKKAGYKLHFVEIMGISRSFSLENVKAAMLMIKSQFQAKKIIKEFKPDIVIGTGGYVCWPALRVASKMGIPTVAHESNARPGLAIKQLQGSLDKILVNFKDTEKYIKNKNHVVHVGNPLRGGFGGYDYAKAREKLGIAEDKVYVLAFGGSLGAQTINDRTFEYMKNHLRGNERVVCHLCTGRNYFKEFTEMYNKAGLNNCENLMLLEYIHDMHVRMSAADVIICRAGAMTISELAVMKKACLMIPSPNVVDNHQYKNAKMLADAEAVVMIQESELNGEVFACELRQLIADSNKRASLAENISSFANHDANKVIYNEILNLVDKK